MTKILAVRIKGVVRSPAKMTDALKTLRLDGKNSCNVLEKTPTIEGALRKVSHLVTWGEPSEDTFVKLVKARARVDEEKIKELKAKDLEDLAKQVYAGKIDAQVLNPPFGLNPPRKGFSRKGNKKDFKSGGDAGNRGGAIDKLIERML